MSSMSADPAAAAKVAACLKDIQGLVGDLEEARQLFRHAAKELRPIQEKVQADERLTAAGRAKLRAHYEDADARAAAEEERLRKALEKIYEIRKIRSEIRIQARNAGNKETIRRGALMKMLSSSAEQIPLWVGPGGLDRRIRGDGDDDDEEADRSPPPLCGRIPAEPNYVAQPGDMAAALVKSPEGDENWILAEVVSYNVASGRYDVDDIDEEQKDRHTLSRRKIIPLPTRRACPETNPEALYEPGQTVMAIYPQTTCFYKGVIKHQPAAAADDYQVLFEDSSYADGYSPPLNVAQRYIIQVSDRKKGK